MGFSDVYMLAGIEGVHGDLGVPMIHGRTEYRVDILTFEQLTIVVEADAVAADAFFGLGNASLRNIAHRRQRQVVLGQQFLCVIDMGVQTLAADADEANGDPVVCPQSRARLSAPGSARRLGS